MLTAKQYMFTGVMGALSFVLAFVLGSAIDIVTGIPLTGGIANGIIVGITLTIGAKGVNMFGGATVVALVATILAIPTPTLGPPGVYKVPIGFLAGLVWDICISVLRRRNIGYILGGASGSIVIIWGLFIALSVMGMPAAESLKRALIILLPFNAFLGGLGTYLGVLLFDRKLKHLTVIKNLQT